MGEGEETLQAWEGGSQQSALRRMEMPLVLVLFPESSLYVNHFILDKY